MQQNHIAATSPTVRWAIWELERRGLRCFVHFEPSDALELWGELQAARSMWEELGSASISAVRAT